MQIGLSMGLTRLGRGGGGAPSLPLDTLTAGAAYSTRLLRTAYTGPLLRVRRSSDNTEQDINAVSGWLDETTLLAFVGSGSGFVTTWYDQSGNSRHVAQATAGSQPRIVNSGVIDKVGGRPTLVFDGSSDVLFNSSPFVYSAGAGTIISLMSVTPVADKRFWAEGNSASNNAIYSWQTGQSVGADMGPFVRNDANTTVFQPNATGVTNTGVFDSALHTYYATDSGTAMNGFIDGEIGTTRTYSRSGTLTLDRFAIGAIIRTSAGSWITARISELLAFGSVLGSGELNTIGLSQGFGWGISVDTYLTPLEKLAQINGTGDGGSSFGINSIGVADWEEPLFIDRAKQARGWVNIAQEHFSADGALASLPGGTTTAEFFFASAENQYLVGTPSGRGGRFRLAFSGSATGLSFGGCSNVTQINANTYEFDCDWNGNKNITMTPTGYPIKCSIVRTDLIAAHNAGEVWSPDYLNQLPSGGCFRFMNSMGTNNSPVVEWSQYPTIQHQEWNRVPFAAMVDLCVQKNMDGWFCVPHQASDDFCTQMAEYLRDNFPESRKIRIELSNEIWNTGTFSHGAYFKGLAEAAWGVADAFVGGIYNSYAGKRFAEVAQIFGNVFAGDEDRLIFVIAGQAASPGSIQNVAEAPYWLQYEPGNYIAPHTFAHEISVAPYLNWVGDKTAAGNTIASALAVSYSNGVQAVKNMLPASLAQSKSWIDSCVSYAAKYNCRMTMYEYNQHYNLSATASSSLYSGGQPITNALNIFVDATYAQETADAHSELRDYFKAKNGSLMCLYREQGRVGTAGTWGAKTHLNHNSAIYNELLDWHANNPRWWSQ